MEKNEKKKINLSKKQIIIGICALLFIIGLVGGIVYYRHQSVLKKSTIDFDSETYKGKEIKVESDRIIIKEENGSETIESFKSDTKKMKEADKKIQEYFKISDVVVQKEVATTKVKGNITPKNNKYKTAVVTVKFYNDNAIAGTSSTIVSKLKKNKKQKFEITLVGDYQDAKYDVAVEFVD